MSLAELKESVLALPEKERHDLFIWLKRLEASHGEIPSASSQDGHFANDYPLPEDRLELEAAVASKRGVKPTKAEVLRAIRKSKLTFTRSWESMRQETRPLQCTLRGKSVADALGKSARANVRIRELKGEKVQ